MDQRRSSCAPWRRHGRPSSGLGGNRQRSRISVADDRLIVESPELVLSRHRRWHRSELATTHVVESHPVCGCLPRLHLRVVPHAGPPFAFLAGRDHDDELLWIATLLRTRLRLEQPLPGADD